MSHTPYHKTGDPADQFATTTTTPTVSPAPTRTPAERPPEEGETFGFNELSPLQILMGEANTRTPNGVFDELGMGIENVLAFLGEGTAETFQGAKNLFSVRGSPNLTGNQAPLDEFLVGTRADLPTPIESQGLKGTNVNIEQRRLDLNNELGVLLGKRKATEGVDANVMPAHVKQQLDEQMEVNNLELERIANEMDELTALEEEFGKIHEAGNEIMEHYGIPGSLEAARTDPEVAKVFDAITQAQVTGEGLDAALDQLDGLSIVQRQGLSSGIEGDEFQDEINRQIKVSMNNLVENRQQVEKDVLDAQDWARNEAQAQQFDPWDVQGDPSPQGRGQDVLVGMMEPFFEGAFNGILTEHQGAELDLALSAIWQTLPSQPTEDAEGEPTTTVFLAPEHRAELENYARVNLLLSPEQVEEMFEQLDHALKRANQAVALAETWKTQKSFKQGEAGIRTGLHEVLVGIYGEGETAQAMSSSRWMSQIIFTRSKGNVTNFDEEASGNQFGLGNLPAHTYTAMGYDIEELADNPEKQIEALINFIGSKYGAGYEGLQRGFSDLLNNPDEWGELDTF